MRLFLAGLVLIVSGVRAGATLQCTALATPATVRMEGLTERMGDIVIRCVGGPPASALNGSFTVFLSAPVTNRSNDGSVDASIAVSNGTDWVPVASTARLVSSSAVSFDNVIANLTAAGDILIQILGLRAPGARTVTAVLSFNGNQQLGFTTPVVTLSVPSRSMLAGDTGLAECPAVAVPDGATVDSLSAMGFPFASTRITEGYAGAFERKAAGADAGTRFLVKWTGAPAAATFVVPDFVAGSSALVPTAGGDMGVAASAGRWMPTSAGSLLLGRVTGTDANGAGGQVRAFDGTLGSVSAADRNRDVVFAVYEVLDSGADVIESAQFPAFLSLPVGSRTTEVVHSTVSLAPASTFTQSSPTAPIPRFTGESGPLDCPFLGDCTASWFPQLQVTAVATLKFRSPQKSTYQTGFLLVHNLGGGILEWSNSVHYVDASNWITLQPAQGVNKATIMVNVSPGDLALGVYHAEVTVQGSPAGTRVTFPVEMTVVEALPPAVVLPKVTAVMNAATRLPGAVAPGSVVVVDGSDFPADAGVTIAAIPATVLSRTASELLAVVPDGSAIGIVDVVVRSGDKASAPYQIQVAPVAPAIFGVINQNGSLNGTGHGAQAGEVLQVFSTGARIGDDPLEVKLQGRVVDRIQFMGAAPGLPGMLQVNFAVPSWASGPSADLVLCGKGVCGPAVPIVLR